MRKVIILVLVNKFREWKEKENRKNLHNCNIMKLSLLSFYYVGLHTFIITLFLMLEIKKHLKDWFRMVLERQK